LQRPARANVVNGLNRRLQIRQLAPLRRNALTAKAAARADRA